MWFAAFLRAGLRAEFLDYLADFYSHMILDYGLSHVGFSAAKDFPKRCGERKTFPSS
jgi:hypothetical protein